MRIFCCMKYIYLCGNKGEGKFAIVEDDDFDRVNKYKWHLHPCGYAIGRPGAKNKILLHRFIMDAQKGEDIDHINGNKLDNRRNNLRACSRTQNKQNQHKVMSASGFKGVSRAGKAYKTKKWIATIRNNGKQINLGYFETSHQAAVVYDFWATYFFGKYAHTNFKVVSQDI